MPTPKECREHAARCAELAEQARDEVTREQLRMARDSWLLLAEDVLPGMSRPRPTSH
jgi:hypothetical protein